MIDYQEMLLRFVVALALGGLMGIEREMIGKGAGVRTAMLVSGGAALFAMISLALPYIVVTPTGDIDEIIARNSGFLAVIANVVVGIGFLGAGIILKTGDRVTGLTTSALIWCAAAVGALAGLGLVVFAVSAAAIVSVLLYGLRKMKLYEHLRPDHGIFPDEHQKED